MSVPKAPRVVSSPLVSAAPASVSKPPVRVSVARVPARVSVPVVPTRVSVPVAPTRVSFPAAPATVSVPVAPARVSVPAALARVSVPARVSVVVLPASATMSPLLTSDTRSAEMPLPVSDNLAISLSSLVPPKASVTWVNNPSTVLVTVLTARFVAEPSKLLVNAVEKSPLPVSAAVVPATTALVPALAKAPVRSSPASAAVLRTVSLTKLVKAPVPAATKEPTSAPWNPSKKSPPLISVTAPVTRDLLTLSVRILAYLLSPSTSVMFAEKVSDRKLFAIGVNVLTIALVARPLRSSFPVVATC